MHWLKDRLKAVLLLGGGVRSSELSRGAGRPILDLPVDPGRSLLDVWSAEAAALAEAVEARDLPVRVLIDAQALEPGTRSGRPQGGLVVERDRAELRGTGGILRDACEAYADEDFVLVANAHQLLLEPLAGLARDLAAPRADVTLAAHDDGAPVGMMLVRAGVTRSIRDRGFVDFKEQVLPRLAADVRVVARPRATAVAVRTLDGYIDALRAHHRRVAGLSALPDEFLEDWVSTFSVIEPGAAVDPSARIHDAVVLAGARVEPGAVVVRSLVPGGARVRSGQTTSDEIVAGTATERGEGGGGG